MKNEHLTPRNSPFSPGDAAPDFTLLDQNRAEWKLSSAAAKGPVVLCFYPMSFTSVCSTEMKCVDSEMASWQSKGLQVVGISCDSFAVQKAWADAENFKHPLLADMHRSVCRAYGLYWPDLNVASRGTVVVEQGAGGGLVVKWSQSREVKRAMDWSEILAAV
ncbi:MAG: redoxin domain-containing protein [Planctomycetota bacterium]|nr:redoxin domain-containing protein [Planctomycetota bacterium]